MTATTTTFAPALKSLWPQKRYNSVVYKNNPFLAMVPKRENFKGKNLVLSVRYKDQVGRSSTFATALANKGASAGAAFTLTRSKDYAIGSIETELILAAEGNEATLAEGLDTESSALMNAITRSLAQSLAGDGTGTIGSRGSNTSSTTTLTNLSDIVNFEVGDKVTAHATLGGAARDSGNVLTVTAVDRDAGTFTYTGSISGYSDADYLVKQGDLNAKIKGLPAWIPYTAADSTAFFGVDRSVDITRLQGCRMDISGLSPEEGLVKMAYRMDREGAIPELIIANPEDVVNVQYALGSKVTFHTLTKGEIGFKAIEINGPKKPIMLLSDMNFAKGYSYFITPSSMALYTLGKAPRILNIDGQEILREYNADSNEIRIAYYGQFGVETPGDNGVVKMPS